MISKTCPVCGCEFTVTQAEANRETHCSWKCRYDPLSRFMKKVNKTESCWLWTGRVDEGGYGRFDWDSKTVLAHRASYRLHIGEIPEGMELLHICDNPRCVNPDHLQPGTHGENMRDMFSKGRRKNASGERNGNSKLSRETVQMIRKEFKESGLTQIELAKRFGVSATVINDIVRNKTWLGAG